MQTDFPEVSFGAPSFPEVATTSTSPELQLRRERCLIPPTAMKLFAATVCVVLAASAFGTLVPASANVDKKFTTHSTRLARRFDPDELANEEIWKHASCKGGRLIDLMMSSDAEAGPKIEQTMDRNKPSARSEWQGDLRSISIST